jgi:predicted kinase
MRHNVGMPNDGHATHAGSPRVHLICGLVGAGKTTYADQLASEVSAVRFSLDEWMLRLYDLRYDDPQYVLKLDGCTSLIWDTARQVLGLGRDVVLDWNQWSRDRRRAWRRRAESAGFGVILHHVDVSLETAIRQAAARAAEGVASAHRLDEDAVRHSSTIFEPPSMDEDIEIVTVSRINGTTPGDL